MIRALTILALFATASHASAETLTTVRPIRPTTIIDVSDLTVINVSVTGGLANADAVVGMEAKVTLYPGRPIRSGDIGPPALVERNQPVKLVYSSGGLTISTDGRALERAAAGDWVRVMNLASRTTVTGQVHPSGAVVVSAELH